MANIYVRKSGSDSNDGSTPALAKLTIAGAISAMASGDIIYVGSGIYREQNLTTGSKNVTIIGDTTGEHTGDAGEVIWSGMNSTDDGYGSYTYAIDSNVDNYNLTIKDVKYQNFKSTSNLDVISKKTQGDLTLENIDISDCILLTEGILRGVNFTSISGEINMKNININNLIAYINTASNSGVYGIHIQGYLDRTHTMNIENINVNCLSLTDNISGGNNEVIGVFIQTGPASTMNTKNINSSNIICFSISSPIAVGIFISNSNIYNSIVKNIFCSYGFLNAIGIIGTSGKTAYNCSVLNVFNGDSAGTSYQDITQSSSVNKSNYEIIKAPQISKFSPLRGQGYTDFPTTDIEGNPRPAYGNGTACDIGASEATSEDVQQESVIKDTGDYSAKVAPCNYFKRQFQIPVTASELRTVKVKIRIDGTWGDYRPKITLSGQGMTASSATKNATIGSFEELTVSGTPTTTGIALLTIEAHSPNTDAAFYIDTITIE